MVEDMVSQMSSIKKFKLPVASIKFNSTLGKNLEKNTHNLLIIYTIIFVIVSIIMLGCFCCLYFNFRLIYSKLSKIKINTFELENFKTNVEAAYEGPDYLAQLENNEGTSTSPTHLQESKTGARKKLSFGKSRFYRSSDYQEEDNGKSQPPAILQISPSQTVNAPPTDVGSSDKEKVKEMVYNKLHRFKFKVKLPSLPSRSMVRTSSINETKNAETVVSTTCEKSDPSEAASNFQNVDLGSSNNDPVDSPTDSK